MHLPLSLHCTVSTRKAFVAGKRQKWLHM